MLIKQRSLSLPRNMALVTFGKLLTVFSIKVITNLDSLNASGPECFPVVILKNCEHELFSICYLATPRPALGHCKEGSLTHLMLITAFCLCLAKSSPRAS